MIQNRTQAGVVLAEKLQTNACKSAVVIGLARGGVPVAAAIALALQIPVDVLVVKKIGSPVNPEFGLGAVAPDGVTFINWRTAHRVGADEEYIKGVIRDTREVIREKTLLYRKKKKQYALRDKIVILADDGAATGASLEAAIKWLRAKKARKIIVALPVAPLDVVSKIKPEVDHLIALETPKEFGSVGEFYKDFEQISDEEVVELLHRHSRVHGNPE